MVSFYDELQPEEWPSYARPETEPGIEADPRLLRAIFGESDSLGDNLEAEPEAVTLKVDEFLDATFEATIVNLLNHSRKGLITVDELVYLEQEAATWFDILLD